VVPNFHPSQSIRCGDNQKFSIFKMAAVYLGFVWGIFGPPTKSRPIWLSLLSCKIWLWSI